MSYLIVFMVLFEWYVRLEKYAQNIFQRFFSMHASCKKLIEIVYKDFISPYLGTHAIARAHDSMCLN